jgi:predicted kinase
MNHRPALWMLIGLIGSGKTTYSKRIWDRAPSKTIRICLDDIIQMMTFYSYQKGMQQFYWELELSPLIKGLSSGYSVILDRTNLTPETRSRYLDIVTMVRDIARELSSSKIPADSRMLSFQDQQKIAFQSVMKGVENEINDSSKYSGDEDDDNLKRKLLHSFQESIQQNFTSTWELSLFEQKDKIEEGESIFAFLNRIAHMEAVGIYFDVPVSLCLERRESDPVGEIRNIHRKINWKSVMCQMQDKIKEPTLEEGFDRILVVNEEMRITSEIGQKSLF